VFFLARPAFTLGKLLIREGARGFRYQVAALEMEVHERTFSHDPLNVA
jgi:hypothetical protein